VTATSNTARLRVVSAVTGSPPARQPLPDAALHASDPLEGIHQTLHAWERDITDCLRAFPEHLWQEIIDLSGNRLTRRFPFLKGEQADRTGKYCEAPKQYVLTTVHRCGLEVCRKRSRRRAILQQVSCLTSSSYASQHENLDLRKAIQRLSTTDQTLVLLTKLKGVSVREAAEELRLAPHVARHRLDKALIKLRTFLGE